MNMGAGRVAFQDLTRIDRFIARRRVLLEPGADVGDGAMWQRRARAAPGRPGVGRRRPQPHPAPRGPGGDGAAERGDEPVRTRHHRWPRHVTHGRHRLRGGARTNAVGGRRWADREHRRALLRDGPGRRWPRTKRAYDAIVHGTGKAITSPRAWLQESYAAGTTDEFIEPARRHARRRATRTHPGRRFGDLSSTSGPTGCGRSHGRSRWPTSTIRARRHAAGVLCLASRATTHVGAAGRVRHRSRSREASPRCSQAHAAENLRLAETEKYAHVTYFFNGGREVPYQGEDRVLVPSPEGGHLRSAAGDERARASPTSWSPTSTAARTRS